MCPSGGIGATTMGKATILPPEHGMSLYDASLGGQADSAWVRLLKKWSLYRTDGKLPGQGTVR